MADFSSCVMWVLRIEDRTLSGKVKSLGDGAGLTRYGITSKNNPQVPAEFFSTMPNDQAIEVAKNVYWQKYWVPIQGNLLPTDELAATLLSFDVNDGAEAVKLIQGCLGVTQDGSFGPGTLKAIQSTNPATLAQCLREAQEAFYENVVIRHPEDERFLAGWKIRARLVYPQLPA